ncbi:hypothetical protein [Candidatus Tisiphia endosymbiont of Mystacides longicornis]|uniref:hypothetical protein n=1 Tax=Candidatus Tisiphia endosymbiont of Mystacides longicornis TaxID=3139330 RepID=UPI003CCA886E
MTKIKQHFQNLIHATKPQKHTNYGRRAKAENAIYRYKSIIGNKLKSRTFLNQKTESKVAANILNIMTKLGMPDTKKFA